MTPPVPSRRGRHRGWWLSMAALRRGLRCAMLTACVVALLAGAGYGAMVYLAPLAVKMPGAPAAPATAPAAPPVASPATPAAPVDAPAAPAVPPAAPVTVVVAGQMRLAGPGGSAEPVGASPLGQVSALLGDGDLSIATLSIAGSRPDMVMSLAGAGLDAVSLVPVNTTDAGGSLSGWLEPLRRAGLYALGATSAPDAPAEPGVFNVGDQRIAVLPVHDGAAGAGETWRPALLRAREAADYVIVLAHWGSGLDQEPTARQRDLGFRMLEAGADVVVGTGPQVRQNPAFRLGRPLVYSLGNLLAPAAEVPAAYVGWLARLTVQGRRLLQLDLVPIRLSAAGLPEPAPDLPFGDPWLVLDRKGLQLWQGRPETGEGDLVSYYPVVSDPACPAGRYAVSAVDPDGISLAREGYAGSQFWLVPGAGPGCPALHRDVFAHLTRVLAPGVPMRVTLP